jgi:dephospho-CoA kinase
MLIGLTGTYCAGKNHVAALLEQGGLAVLDVDKLGYIAIEREKDVIFSRFGIELKKSDGTVDRRQLGKRVFGKSEELAALESIVHPVVDRLIDEWIAAQNGKNCVINAALLHKADVFKRLDCIILIKAPLLTRLLRAKKRDGLAWTALLRRFASQKKFAIHYLEGNADIYRVKNPGLSNSQRLREKLERRINTIISQKLRIN